MSALEAKIGLGLDLSRFDSQLRTVADRIESAGKGASQKMGSLAGDVAAGKLNSGQLGAQFANIGTKITAGIAGGLRQSSSLMLGFGARINAMIDNMVGTAVTMFLRIDAAMKFPDFDAFFTGAQKKLSNFSAIWRKPLSDVDLAIGGAFGGTIAKITKVLKGLFDTLAQRLGESLGAAVRGIADEFKAVVAQIHRAEGSAEALLKTTESVARVGPRFPSFAPMGPPGNSRRPFPGTGRRLGANVEFTAPAPVRAPVVPKLPTAEFGAEMNKVWGQFSKGITFAASLVPKFGAALISVPLRAIVPFRRLGNFVSTLGDVGRASYHKLYEENGLLVGTIMAATKAVGGLGRGILNVATLGVFKRAGKDADDFGKSVKGSIAPVNTLSGRVRNLGREIMVAFGVVGVAYKFVEFLKNSISAASDLAETVNRSKVVFGDAFGPIEAQANRMQKAFGVSRQATLDLASGFGAMAQGAPSCSTKS